MSMNDPKFNFETSPEGGRIISRDSGPIPLDEPVFIFRARDVHAIPVLDAYLQACAGGPTQHVRAISARIAEFMEFARRHPERMKAPDTEFPHLGAKSRT